MRHQKGHGPAHCIVRCRMFRKLPRADLKSRYTLFFEAGVIAALLILIAAAHFRIPQEPVQRVQYVESDGLALVLPPVTQNVSKVVPPPPTPDIPVTIPDDTPLEPEKITFDEFELMTEIDPPKLAQEIEVFVDYEKLKEFEVLPKMIGGEQAFRKSIEYPYFARSSGIEGIVEVEFTVTKQGAVKDPVIVRGIGGGCDKAVLKAIQLQHYTPGVKNGKFIEFRIKETVQFILIGKNS